MENTIEVYLEVAEKRALAAAIDWPGWARFGKDETAALQALIEYGPRYERVVRRASLTFHAPASVSVFKVVETLPGSPDTAFGSITPLRGPGRRIRMKPATWEGRRRAMRAPGTALWPTP